MTHMRLSRVQVSCNAAMVSNPEPSCAPFNATEHIPTAGNAIASPSLSGQVSGRSYLMAAECGLCHAMLLCAAPRQQVPKLLCSRDRRVPHRSMILLSNWTMGLPMGSLEASTAGRRQGGMDDAVSPTPQEHHCITLAAGSHGACGTGTRLSDEADPLDHSVPARGQQ